MADVMIDIQNVSIFANKNCIIEDISLKIYYGEMFSILGPNGSGKTMLLQGIIGLRKFDAGTMIKSNDITMSYMPQNVCIPRNLPIKIRDFILLYCDQINNELCEKLNISQLLNVPIQDVSGGEVRKVIFAALIMNDADLLVLDEPEQHLDTKSKMDMYIVLKDEIKKGKTVIIVSHDPQLNLQFSDNIACIHQKLHYFGKNNLSNLQILKNNANVDVIKMIKAYVGNENECIELY